jgi:H-type lectin domain-containing protein
MNPTTSNLTKLKKKLIPPPDGQDVAKLRTATVTSVNSNGTLNIVLNGATVPSVPRLAGAFAVAGSVVQVLTYRGSLLVLGAVAPGPAGAMTKTGAVTAGPSAATSFTSAVVPFGVTFPAVPNVHLNMSSAPGTTSGWNERAINITTTGFQVFGYGASTTFSVSYQWTAIYAP